MNCSTPGLPVHHQLPEFTQTHIHRVGDAIQPSHPLSSLSSCPQSLPASESSPMIPLLKENFRHLKLCLTTPLACFLFHSSWKYRIWGFILYFITYLNYNSDRHHLTFLSMTGYVSKERIMQCVCQYCLFKGFQSRNITYFSSVS